MSESHESEALLPNATRNHPRDNQKCIGRSLAVLSALTFALANFFIKKWHLDFVDVLFCRAFLQIVIFGPMNLLKGYNFLPNKEDSSFKLKICLLILQVSTVFNFKITYLFVSNCISGYFEWYDCYLCGFISEQFTFGRCYYNHLFRSTLYNDVILENFQS